MINKLFYRLSSTTTESCDITKADYEEARKTWLCLACCSPKPGVREIDVYLDLYPEDIPLNFINGCGLGIAQKAFLCSLGEDEAQRDLYLGQVYGPDGTRLDKYVSYHSYPQIIVRGNQHVACRRCTECGRTVYFAMGKQYLYPLPPQGKSIYYKGNGGLVVTEELFQRIDVSRWKKLATEALPVLDEPLDGLGDLTT
ncbi:hypothetical protein [Methylocaldum sp. RMAD-M]|jgi:hypothetical protein|uniref:hypothetical protein n=1 Tax=Methylocaldum sp. RMAD-M TaxID=2806557 RepID=UPI0012EBBA32|nr:hypothetical protein [Methylocaldum sp. RMAD-M]MBP1151324.1 hypothetical protein [Methylocaldum sp. RMAD-M]MVF25039.1 hypothetical protein [Methylocaldum sp. BRCS4]